MTRAQGPPLPLLLTPGMGIGAEVSLAALSRVGVEGLILLGRWSALEEANRAFDLPLRRLSGPEALERTLSHPASGSAQVDGVPVFDPGDAVEPAEVAAIRAAAHACLRGAAAALVTGPIHKKRLSERGFAFHGHTDFLASLCPPTTPPLREVMAFVGGELRLALVTTHIPLKAVPTALDRADILTVIETAAQALVADLGLEAPRIAVCGLNPHAGEEGLLGDEERLIIGPACEDARAGGLNVTGPVSAETAFLGAREGRFDLIVAMYHDQGLAPLKAVDFGRSVNWTLGLPLLRLSVDHGTADHLVGAGQADPASMISALTLARQIAARRGALRRA